MNTQLETQMKRAALLLCTASLLAACNTTPSKRTAATPAHIEVMDSVGFTITEDSRVSGDVRSDYDRALGLLGRGDLNGGIALLESVTSKSPDLSAPRIDLAIAYHNRGDFEMAESELKHVLDMNPDHPIALNELGIIYRKTARFAESRRSYEAALAVYPGYHYARRNLAVLCDLYLEDLDCARQNYEAYMATVHSDEEASMWLRNVRFRMGDMEN